MINRQPLFPHVIEMNHAAGHRVGCSVYLVYDEEQWLLIDIGFEDTVDDIIELIRQLDFPLSKCVTLVATHADADHVQGLARAKQLIKTTTTGHPLAAKPLAEGDRLKTFAEIQSQGIDLAMRSRSVVWSLKSGTHLATRTVNLRFGWVIYCFLAITFTVMDVWARSMPIMVAIFPTLLPRCVGFAKVMWSGCCQVTVRCFARTMSRSIAPLLVLRAI